MSKSITFNQGMVCALISGNKTRTTRPITPQATMETYGDGLSQYCPFGGIGDVLWVREAYQLGLCADTSIGYAATHLPTDLEDGQDEVIEWRCAKTMPEWASRIKIKITNIRVEGLHDITECGAQAEGAKPSFKDEFDIVHSQPSYRDGFILNIWNEIYHGKHKPEFSWDNNPWVWVINFEMVKPNV